jgi:hypothetical protein
MLNEQLEEIKKPLWLAGAKIYYHSQMVDQKRIRFVGTIKVRILG